MNEFNIGDRVKIVRNIYPDKTLADFNVEEGWEGNVVYKYTYNIGYELGIQFDKRLGVLYCSPEELEHVGEYQVELL